MSNVQAWAAGVLNPDDEEQVIKVTIRLDGGEVAELDELARKMNISRTACATGLVRSGMEDLKQFMFVRQMQDENLERVVGEEPR